MQFIHTDMEVRDFPEDAQLWSFVDKDLIAEIEQFSGGQFVWHPVYIHAAIIAGKTGFFVIQTPAGNYIPHVRLSKTRAQSVIMCRVGEWEMYVEYTGRGKAILDQPDNKDAAPGDALILKLNDGVLSLEDSAMYEEYATWVTSGCHSPSININTGAHVPLSETLVAEHNTRQLPEGYIRPYYMDEWGCYMEPALHELRTPSVGD